MQNHLKLITRLFPVWALLLSVIAFYFPQTFVSLKPGIIPLLAVIMLSMGMTLTADDFKRVLQKPKIILIGLLLHLNSTHKCNALGNEKMS